MTEEIQAMLGEFGVADYIVNWIVFFLVFVRAWAILWVTKDISLRSESILLQIISILLVVVFTPIVWLPLYFVIRPVTYKHERLPWRDYLVLNVLVCKDCWNYNLKEFNYCVHCGENLKTKCKECKNHYGWEYEYCPYCWAPNLEDWV